MTEFEKNTRSSFGKSERLSSHKIIDSLFSKGKSFNRPPYVVKYILLPDEAANSHQILVSVPKRNFKRAVDRNRLKRQIKEAYRLNKHLLGDLSDKYAIAYIYTLKKMLPYKDIESKLIECLYRLQTELSSENED